MSGNYENGNPLDEFSGALLPQNGRTLDVVAEDDHRGLVVPPSGKSAASAIGMPGPAAWLRALRRRWFICLLIGLTGAAALGIPAWLMLGSEYATSATLLVQSSVPTVAFDGQSRASLQEYDVYKRSQQQLVASRFVLTKAVGRREIAALEIIRNQVDPIKWLQDELVVRFPGNAEIMEVYLAAEDPDAIAKIVNAIVEAYMDEVVYAEKNKRQEKLNNLNEVMFKMAERLRNRREVLEQRARAQNSSDTAVLSLKQQIKLQQYSQLQQKLTSVEFDLMAAQTQLATQKTLLQSQGGPPISEFEIESLLDQDPTIAPLLGKVSALRDQFEEESQRLRDVSMSRVKPRLDEAEKALAKRRDEVRQKLLDRQKEQYQYNMQAEIKAAEAQIKMLMAQRDALQKSVNQLDSEARTIGQSSVEIEMVKGEVDQLDAIVNRLRTQIETLSVEVDAPSRVQTLEKAQVPKTKDIMRTVQLTAFLSLLGFALPVAGICFLEVRARRIHNTNDVIEGLGMRVIGVVPSLRGYSQKRNARSQGSSSAAYWNGILRESVDGVRTMLLRKESPDEGRVVLVTSAMAGEGKTSLASQLAMSFARAGRKTLIVDCDFRKPGVHEAFGLPLEPGVCNVLRGEQTLAEGIRPTQIERLWLLPASHTCPKALSALSQGALAECFHDLRQEYDFIVVDAAPVLPVVDTMIVAQNVDFAVLSVLCDVSRSPRVYAAAEKLSEVGVHVVGTVVSAVSEEVYTLAQRPMVDVEPAADTADTSAA